MTAPLRISPSARSHASVLRLVAALAIVLLLAAAPLGAARGEDIAARYPQAREFFPTADRFGATEGDPPAAPVYRGDALLGYVFLTNDVVRIPAYSGKPINTLIGFDVAGRITGVAIVQHEEPILAVGISEARLKAFTDQYRGKSVFDKITIGGPREDYVAVDTISGATITVMVQNATIMRAALRVAESRGLRPGVATAAAVAPPPAAAPVVESPGAAVPETARAVAPSGTERAPPPPAATEKAVRPGRSQPPPRPQRAAPAPIAQPPLPAPPAMTGATGAEEPLWKQAWRERWGRIVLLVAGLATLTAILVFQDWLARRPTLLWYLRRGFLLYTLFFIGWFALAQLSVMHVLTFMHAFMHEFRWENFLIDPMLFILWGFVALTLLLWGRGVYCGWLCPYGALQELGNQIARRFGVRQIEFPDVVHERLWAVKYLVLILLFGVSLQSLGEAARYAEVEPFKTTVVMGFQREWPFVLYAGALLLVAVFNRKFYCKYLCPLGAALAIPGRFRVFDWWLRRRKECGHPCQTCARECEVRAIRPTGEINANECHYCLDCQVTYYDDNKCMPLVERKRRHERASRAREMVHAMEPHAGAMGLDESAEERGGRG
ncbi:MAG: 4Fe-4S binding protein [Burkholderiales bacterium]|nr:4Fe-4S binding protein [Burkholderiales bacterium]